MTRPRLILGSGSPRRRELLAQIGIVPDAIRPPEIDEDPRPGEVPRDYVKRIAREKAKASACGSGEIVLCADTTVALGRRIMGKPADADEARAFLKLLSGRRHNVITAVAVKTPAKTWLKDVLTSVKIKPLHSREIEAYIATNDWQGKAGGYAIQGPAGCLVPWINGSFTGVVGLPLAETAGLLAAAGYPVTGGAP